MVIWAQHYQVVRAMQGNAASLARGTRDDVVHSEPELVVVVAARRCASTYGSAGLREGVAQVCGGATLATIVRLTVQLEDRPNQLLPRGEVLQIPVRADAIKLEVS